jgi:hypothetical protein
MNSKQNAAWRERVEELLLECRTRRLTPPEREELNAILRNDSAARSHAARFLFDDAALAEELRVAQIERLMCDDGAGIATGSSPAPVLRRGIGWLQWRPLVAAAAGLVFGLFCASVAWAYAGSRMVATISQLFELKDGGFEGRPGRLPSGFPVELGVWSGDVAEVAATDGIVAKEGRQALRFIRAKPDAISADGRADACDMSQLVDLRPLREVFVRGNAVLELSASFADARRVAGKPVRFACQLMVYQGRPEELRHRWPNAKEDALANAKGRSKAMNGTSTTQWQSLAVRVLLPPTADFAVVRLLVRREGPSSTTPAEFGEQFVDDVKLVLNTQPELPVHISKR